MTGSPAPLSTFYRPREVARMLRCSEWWVMEQARRRRIPFIRIGRRFLFTAEHVTEIVRRFEERPPEEPSTVVEQSPQPSRKLTASDGDGPARLTARVPRRARAA